MGNAPQKIKISALTENPTANRFFCLFQLIREFLAIRGGYDSEEEPFFNFRGNSTPVNGTHVRELLKILLQKLNLNPALYSTHSFRAGRMVDLEKMGYSLPDLKRAGRWQSNAVYNYLKY